MLKIIKKLLQNKKTLLFITGVGLVFVLLPLHSAKAAIWDDIYAALKFIPDFFLGLGFAPFLFPLILILLFFVLTSAFSFLLSIILLQWVTSGHFITLQFTQGGIVDAGWQSTQGFANLLFVLILVFIAFATILKLENYGLKKLLPKFIIAVILINFSKVIAGGIIDIANLVTRSFFSFNWDIFLKIFNPFSAEIDQLKELFNGELKGAFDFMKSWATFSGMLEHIIRYTLIIFYGFFSSFVFGIYFILFVVRYITIWLLVILAPLAWACMVLPQTQKYWKMWWSYFLQWAFIGAIAGFFLKLGSIAVVQLSGRLTDFSAVAVAVNCPAGEGFCWTQAVMSLFNFILQPLNATMLYTMVLAFLIMGFIISVNAAKGGTQVVLKAAERGGRAAGQIAGPRIWAGTKQAFSENNKYISRIKGEYNEARASGKGRIGAFMGAPLGVLRRDYNEARDAKASKKDSVAAAIHQTGPAGRVAATQFLAVEDAIKKYKEARDDGVKRIAAFKQGLGEGKQTVLRDSATMGIWSAIKDSSRDGWKAAVKTKKEKQKKTRKDAAGNEITELFCPDCGTGPLTPDTIVCPKCKAIIS